MIHPVRTAVRDGRPVQVKECRVCHEVKVVADDESSGFGPARRRLDGTVAAWRPECVLCYRLQSAAQKRRDRRIPERRARMARSNAAWKASKRAADPAYFAEMARLQYRLRQERAGVKPTRSLADVLRSPDRQDSLPGQPLAGVIQGLAESRCVSVMAVCEEMGIEDRRFRDWRAGRSGASFACADRVLTDADVNPIDLWAADEYPAVAVRFGYADWHAPIALVA